MFAVTASGLSPLRDRLRFEREMEALGLGGRAEPQLFAEREDGIIGNDERVEVTDTRPIPYRWVCSVTFEQGLNTLSGGSGVLISERHVLTAAHVVRDWRSGPNSSSLIVYAGRSYGGELGRFTVADVRLSPSRLDFALITLNQKVPPDLMWWGHPQTATDLWTNRILPISDLLRTPFPIQTAGYPGSRDARRRRMVSTRGDTIPTGFNTVFRHSADTGQGQSGSPIWLTRNNRLVLLGIATGATARGPNNWGLLLYQGGVRSIIDGWIAADRPKRRYVLERPYRWVCRVEVSDNSNGRLVGFGSGVLISDRHAMTSASVIHAFARDPMRYTVRVTPGYEFGQQPFEGTTASRGRVAPGFSVEAKDPSSNYGLLTLTRAVGLSRYASIGNIPLGHWGGKDHGLSTSPADLKSKRLYLAAYSRASGGGGQFQLLRIASGKLLRLNNGLLGHDAGNRLDAPGAPIWTGIDGRRLLCGITSPLFAGTANLACYLGEEPRTLLNQWITEDYQRS